MPSSESFVISCIKLADYDLSITIEILLAKIELLRLSKPVTSIASNLPHRELPSNEDFKFLFNEACGDNDIMNTSLRQAANKMLDYDYAYITDTEIGWVKNSQSITENRRWLLRLIQSSISYDVKRFKELIEMIEYNFHN